MASLEAGQPDIGRLILRHKSFLLRLPHFVGFDVGYVTATKASNRDFLKLTSAGVASTALGVTTSGYASIIGANDRVRVAICGVRGRGNDHIHGFSRVLGTDIAALCDVDESVLNRRLGDIEKMGSPKPKSYVDVRKLLEDKDIDAISIATPNHWHSLMAIWASQAGKDVYRGGTLSFCGRVHFLVHSWSNHCYLGFQSAVLVAIRAA